MGCCGKKIAQVVGKVATIAEGNLRLFIDMYFRLPNEHCKYAARRRATCRRCESSTWMTRWQFALWVHRNGGVVRFLKDIDDLTGWPLLPAREYRDSRKLFCRICKCWLPAKSYVESERCPVGNPAWEIEV